MSETAILVVSYPNDDHVEEVRRFLPDRYALFDTGTFPAITGLSSYLDTNRDCISIVLADGRRICLNDVGAVWYRRISPYKLCEDLTDETGRMFARSESTEAMLGVWYSMPCFWMNRPIADEVAQRKIRQLRLARQLGLSTPDTLVTNRPDDARDFIARHGLGNVVRKAFRNIPQAPRETHLLTDGDVERLESVRHAPVIFQKFVPAECDLRVTVVGEDLFAAAIYSQPQFSADFRPGLASAKVTEFKLPDEVGDRLLALMESLELEYGAIDLRLTSDGEYVFLEVNPAGEFLFISRRTGLPIAEAIAASLVRHASDHQSVPCSH